MGNTKNKLSDRRIRGMLFRDWINGHMLFFIMAIAWFSAFTVFAVMQELMVLVLLFPPLTAVLLSVGLLDKALDEGEFQLSIPPTRSQRYWVHYWPGFAVILLFTTATALLRMWDIPQLLWSPLVDGPFVADFGRVPWFEYALLVIAPLTVYTLAYAMCSNTPRLGKGSIASLLFAFVAALGITFLIVMVCATYESGGLGGPFGGSGTNVVTTGFLSCPALILTSVFGLIFGGWAVKQGDSHPMVPIAYLVIAAASVFTGSVLPNIADSPHIASTGPFSPMDPILQPLVDYQPSVLIRYIAAAVILPMPILLSIAMYRYFTGCWQMPKPGPRLRRLTLGVAMLIAVILTVGTVVTDRMSLNEYIQQTQLTLQMPVSPVAPPELPDNEYHGPPTSDELTPVEPFVLQVLVLQDAETLHPLAAKSIVIESQGKRTINMLVDGYQYTMNFNVDGSGWINQHRWMSVHSSTLQQHRELRTGFYVKTSIDFMFKVNGARMCGNTGDIPSEGQFFDSNAYRKNSSMFSIYPWAHEGSRPIVWVWATPFDPEVGTEPQLVSEAIDHETLNIYLQKNATRTIVGHNYHHSKRLEWLPGAGVGMLFVIGMVVALFTAFSNRPIVCYLLPLLIVLAPIGASYGIVHINEQRLAESDDPAVREYAAFVIENNAFTDREMDPASGKGYTGDDSSSAAVLDPQPDIPTESE